MIMKQELMKNQRDFRIFKKNKKNIESKKSKRNTFFNKKFLSDICDDFFNNRCDFMLIITVFI